MNLFKKKVTRIQELENQVNKLKATNAKLTTEKEALLEVRDDSKVVEAQRLDNEAMKLGLDARESYLDIREAYLTKLSEDMKWDTIVETRPTYSVQRYK